METSIISPPADSALIVQVTPSGEAVPNMNVTATGPHRTSRQSRNVHDGCAILAVPPGEYTLNVNKLGYVDQNGYANSDEDPVTDSSLYVVAETTVKKGYKFAQAGALEVGFETLVTKVEGDSFVGRQHQDEPRSQNVWERSEPTESKSVPKNHLSVYHANNTPYTQAPAKPTTRTSSTPQTPNRPRSACQPAKQKPQRWACRRSTSR